MSEWTQLGQTAYHNDHIVCYVHLGHKDHRLKEMQVWYIQLGHDHYFKEM